MTPQNIMSLVAAKSGVTVAQIMGKSREQVVVVPRWKAMWLCRKHFRASFETVGRWFKKDHGTVLYGLRRLNDLPVKEIADLPELEATVGEAELLRPYNFQDHVGRRVLLKKVLGNKVSEAKVLKVTDSGEYVQLAMDDGRDWCRVNDWKIMDVL